MESSVRKDILTDGVASLVGLALAIYSLATLKQPDLLRLITAVAGVGVFLYCSIRYAGLFRQLQKKEKG